MVLVGYLIHPVGEVFGRDREVVPVYLVGFKIEKRELLLASVLHLDHPLLQEEGRVVREPQHEVVAPGRSIGVRHRVRVVSPLVLTSEPDHGEVFLLKIQGHVEILHGSDVYDNEVHKFCKEEVEF